MIVMVVVVTMRMRMMRVMMIRTKLIKKVKTFKGIVIVCTITRMTNT